MRLNDLRGAQVWTFAWASIVCRISIRVAGWKISGARRFCGACQLRSRRGVHVCLL